MLIKAIRACLVVSATLVTACGQFQSGVSTVNDSISRITSQSTESHFEVTSPSDHQVAGEKVSITGKVGSEWTSVAAFDATNMHQISADVAPVNGSFALEIDASALGAGAHNLIVRARGGKDASATKDFALTLNIAAQPVPMPVPAPLPAPTPAPVPTPAPTPSVTIASPAANAVVSGIIDINIQPRGSAWHLVGADGSSHNNDQNGPFDTTQVPDGVYTLNAYGPGGVVQSITITIAN